MLRQVLPDGVGLDVSLRLKVPLGLSPKSRTDLKRRLRADADGLLNVVRRSKRRTCQGGATSMNPVKALMLGTIRLYQLTLSPWVGRECRYLPTCSNYAIEAIKLHGAVKGDGSC